LHRKKQISVLFLNCHISLVWLFRKKILHNELTTGFGKRSTQSGEATILHIDRLNDYKKGKAAQA
jgi:hypothetical protein